VLIEFYRNVGSVRHSAFTRSTDDVATVQLQLLASSFLTLPTRPLPVRHSIEPLLSIFFHYQSKPRQPGASSQC